MQQTKGQWLYAVSVAAVLIITTSYSQAQPIKTVKEKKDFIAALADGRMDSILVRWSPSSLLSWQLGNKFGYKLERYTIMINGKANPTVKKSLLTISPIRPYSKERFDEVIGQDEKAAIVKSGIYNEDVALVKGNADLKTLVNAQQQLEMQMGFCVFTCDVNPLIAQAAGLMYIDKKIQKNERYLYKISLAEEVKGNNIEAGLVNIGSAQKLKMHPPKIKNVQWGNFIASVQWDCRLDIGVYTAYYLERSTDGSNFKAVSDLPIINASENPNSTIYAYQDSLKDNQQVYNYRIRGITPFGETGPYSEVVKGRGTDQFDNLPVIHTGVGDLKTKKAIITWSFPQEHLNEVKGYTVLKADNADGPYTELNKELLKPTETSFTDNKPQQSNYYKIKAIGKQEEVSVSFPYFVAVADVDPPVAPVNIAGKISNEGMVLLKWKQNTENDLLGYRVFRANNLKEEFVEISKDFIKRNAFSDTVDVKTLTKKVYYKLVAVDNNFNNSQYSEPFELKRPDKIAPAKPLFSEMKMQKKGGIRLVWTASVSDDVVKYLLQRINKEEGDAKDLLTWNPTKTKMDSIYIDTTALMGNIYYYKLTAYDDAGNSSFGRTGELEYESGIRKKITDFKSIVDIKARTVTLTWSYPQKVEKYTLYRCKKGQPMEIYKTFEDKELVTFWIEKNLPIGNYYQYQIKADLPGDIKTEISDVLEVKY